MLHPGCFVNKICFFFLKHNQLIDVEVFVLAFLFHSGTEIISSFSGEWKSLTSVVICGIAIEVNSFKEYQKIQFIFKLKCEK